MSLPPDRTTSLLRLAPWGVGFILFVLFGFGSTSASANIVAPPWDKVVHFCVFAALSFGLRSSFPRFSALMIAVLAAAIGAADEFHQMLVPDRQPGFDDWFADLAGITVGLIASHFALARRPASRDNQR